MLAVDPAAETNNLLRLLVQGADNKTLTPADLSPPSFNPSNAAVRINALFSVSLTFSILASFGALLGQQWILDYSQRGSKAQESDTSRRETVGKLSGAIKWNLRGIVEVLLPTCLQMALFLFMVAFVDFLRQLNPIVGLPTLVLSAIGASTFLFTIVSASINRYSPFRTYVIRRALVPAVYKIIVPIYSAYSVLRDFMGWSPYTRSESLAAISTFVTLTPTPLAPLHSISAKLMGPDNLELTAEYAKRAIAAGTCEELNQAIALNVPLLSEHSPAMSLLTDSDTSSALAFRRDLGDNRKEYNTWMAYNIAICHLGFYGLSSTLR